MAASNIAVEQEDLEAGPPSPRAKPRPGARKANIFDHYDRLAADAAAAAEKAARVAAENEAFRGKRPPIRNRGVPRTEPLPTVESALALLIA